MTTPAEIRNIADLYRILEEQPQWNEALRSRMLSAELLAMPQQLASLQQTAAEHTRQFIALRQAAEENTRQVIELRQTAEEHTRQLVSHTAELKALRQIAEEHTRQLVSHTAELKELRLIAEENTRQLVELRRITENHTARMTRMETDSGKIKGGMAQFDPVATSVAISSYLDLWDPKKLPTDQLLAIARDLGLNRSDRESFVNADLVFQVTDDDEQTFLCAVEISWTINQYDIDRAQRNADLLQRALRHPARAVVYGDRYENGLTWENVHWVKMKDRS